MSEHEERREAAWQEYKRKNTIPGFDKPDRGDFMAGYDIALESTKPRTVTTPGSKFSFRRIYSDPTGYYYDDWGRAVPIEVVAETEVEAHAKGFALCGPPPSGKRWLLRLDKVEAVTP